MLHTRIPHSSCSVNPCPTVCRLSSLLLGPLNSMDAQEDLGDRSHVNRPELGVATESKWGQKPRAIRGQAQIK